MSANARLDDAHGWKHRKRSASLCSLSWGCGVVGEVGMLLGPEGTCPAPLWGAGFVVSCAGCESLCSYRLLSSFGWVESVWWVLIGVCGLVGVCELDSGCEHLVVMFCGLFECCHHRMRVGGGCVC
jgi:hypothetical protein